jgi:AraC-like DNA-binding protein
LLSSSLIVASDEVRILEAAWRARPARVPAGSGWSSQTVVRPSVEAQDSRRMGRVLTTNDVPLSQSTEYWVDAICNAYVQLDCRPQELSGLPLQGQIQQNQLSSLDVCVVDASPQSILRTQSLIGRSNEDVFIVSIQAKGVSQISQDGRSAELMPGDFGIFDSTRPYTLLYPRGLHLITLKVPRRSLLSQLPNAEKLTAQKVSGGKGAGHLLLTMIQTLLDDIGDLDPMSYDAVSTGVIDILTAGLRTLDAGAKPTPTALTTYHLERLRAHVRENLQNASLSVQSTSQALQMSVSSIYRVLETQGQTLADMIWNQRLEHCRKELADPLMAAQSVTTIAFRWGFSDASHMGRLFKRAYGLSPRDYRERAIRNLQ